MVVFNTEYVSLIIFNIKSKIEHTWIFKAHSGVFTSDYFDLVIFKLLGVKQNCGSTAI